MKLHGCIWLTLLAITFALPDSRGASGKLRIALYDTGASSAKEISSEHLDKKDGWALIPGKENPASFKGDAILINKLLAVAVRKKGTFIEVYSRIKSDYKLRATVVPLGFEKSATISATKVATNGSGEITLHVSFKSEAGKTSTVAITLKPREGILKTKAVSEAQGVYIRAASRMGVLPDFFADDMLLDATVIPVPRTAIPSENFFLNLIKGGSAIVASIWDKNKQDIQLDFTGEGDAREISGVSIPFGKEGSIWICVLEGPGIWHQVDVNAENSKKAMTLDWKIPFNAKWKANLGHKDHSSESWEFKYHLKKRHMWSGVVGGYDYPCWVDGKEEALKAHIQFPSKFQKTTFAGPTIIYPIDRSPQTPPSCYTIVDLMNNSLGMGPCEYIMDVEGQGNNKGLYTCQTYDYLAPLWEAGLRKQEEAFFKKTLNDSLIFVTAIQDRINQYVEFATKTKAYLGEQKTAKPEISEFLSTLEKVLAGRNISGKKASGGASVKKIIEKFIPDITADRPKQSGQAVAGKIRGIGLSQDNRVARCRLAVKILRQKATLAMAMNPKTADVAKEIRKRCNAILGKSLGHEMR